ncbi:MAG: glycosyltransferase [Acidobacteria bacterium]|nr:glycosyltransferase [Acidobacteriota bacterium]
MKVTIVGPAYPLRGGIAHHTYWLRKALLARGHTVQVISFRQLYPALLFPGSTETDASNFKLDTEALALLTSLNPLTWFAAIRQVKAFAPDLVVFQWWQSFFAPLVGTLTRAFRKAGIKQLIECHNVFPHEGTPLDRQLLKFAFAPVDSFIVHAEKNRRDLVPLVGDKSISVSALPSLPEFRSLQASPRNGRTILFFGKVRKYKGLHVLLEAMPKVLAEIACELVVIGEFYEPLNQYQQRLQELGIAQQVRLENRYVANEEVPAIFAQADVLVLPYVTASQSAVAQIALSNALPVIASTAGGLAETVLDEVNGLLFPPGDAAALAQQLIHYFRDNLGAKFAAQLRQQETLQAPCTLIEIIEATMQEATRGGRHRL